jgi:P4 family phage/plasmid primase-like protien
LIDFNDTKPLGLEPHRYDLDEIVRRLRDTVEQWVPSHFPNGRRNADEWRLANIRGDAPRKQGSCVITLKGEHAGDWIDFDGNGGGGPLSALEHATGLSGRALYAYAAELVGCPSNDKTVTSFRPVPLVQTTRDRKAADEIDFILSRTEPLPGSFAQTYLSSRGLIVPQTPDLFFHSDVTYWDTKTGHPAMIAIVRDVSGERIAIHRTYLQPDGSGKADVKKPRMMLGSVACGAVRLGNIGEACVLGISEGIETGLSVMAACPDLPVWAALSAGNMAKIQLPPEATNVVLLADHDASKAGIRAAQKAAQRFILEGRKVWIATPFKAGEDFNDLLMRDGPDAVAAIVNQAEEVQAQKAQAETPASGPESGKAKALYYDETEDGIARAFADKYQDDLRYCHHTGSWFRWDGQRWFKEETRLAFDWTRILCRDLNRGRAEKLAKAATAAAVERFAQADRVFAVTSRIWDADPWLLGAPEGTVDLRTGTVFPANRHDYITKIATVSPTSQGEASHPLWSRFLSEATDGNEELQRFLRQMAGYSLTGDTREHALFFVYGPGGNGKSVFLNTLVNILGDYACTSAMDTFTASGTDRHPTDLAMLKGARLVSVSETEEGRAWAESRIKQLTGGDKISARFMRQDFFEYLPQFKLLIVGNHKPVLRNVDDAARRRFNIIPFIHKPATPDRQLEQKLRAEYPAVLRWMINGCLDWQMHGLIKPAVVRQATQAYFDDQDLFGQWIEECCVVGGGEWETTAKLYASWKAYADTNGVRPGSIKSFSASMVKREFVADRKWVNGKAQRLFRGLAVRFNPEDSGIIHD